MIKRQKPTESGCLNYQNNHCGLMKSVLLALWGDPLGWKRVKYSMNNEKYLSITSSSVISRNKNIDKSFIFIPDSIFPELLNSVDNLKDCFKSKLIDHIKNYDTESADFINKSDVNIFPSMGSYYKDKLYRYDVDIKFLYSYFYVSILKSIEFFNDIDTFLIDTTHGVNFMQLIFTESVRHACNTYSLNYRRNIKLEFYNSDPYYKSDDTILNINTIKIDLIDSKNILSVISRDFLNKYKDNKNSIKNYFKKINRDGLEIYIKACSIMVQSDIIPYLLYVIDNKHQCFNIDQENNFSITIKNDGNLINVQQDFPDSIKINIESLAFIDSLRAVYNSMKSHNKYNIKDIYDLTDIFFGSDSDITFLKNELKNIKNNKMRTHGRYIDLSEFTRNFKAHAGLLDYICNVDSNCIEFKTASVNNKKIDMDFIVESLVRSHVKL
ncbi:CRISPR-associated protein, Csx1 family [Picrophilus oshimae DSM 9789]|uniref:CRISPR-associated protein, Csx1 family n=2 Tax=Picrophilus oshimae TaxID=46632 RepID=A0A8G2FXS1_PICTO|nr:CRISPR-associated protein, Csx1 family [Picrophilus oshimae DSM 9789]